MTVAQRIRTFLEELFHSNYVEDLKRERDYFRARADRLELMLLQKSGAHPIIRPRTANAQAIPMQRKSWIEVQREDLERQEKEFQEAQKAKEA